MTEGEKNGGIFNHSETYTAVLSSLGTCNGTGGSNAGSVNQGVSLLRNLFGSKKDLAASITFNACGGTCLETSSFNRGNNGSCVALCGNDLLLGLYVSAFRADHHIGKSVFSTSGINTAGLDQPTTIGITVFTIRITVLLGILVLVGIRSPIAGCTRSEYKYTRDERKQYKKLFHINITPLSFLELI
jgi:hypothetical protein